MEQNFEQIIQEALRDINRTTNKHIYYKNNGFGINEIKFISRDKKIEDKGIHLHLQATGSAIAKTQEHLRSMLKNMEENCREELWRESIFINLYLHTLNTSPQTFDENFGNEMHFVIYGAGMILFHH